MVLYLLLTIILTAFASWLLLWILCPMFGLFLLDLPNTRSSHSEPAPRGGGVVFVLISSVATVFFYFLSADISPTLLSMIFLPVLALPLALVGFLDDLYSLPVGYRYCVQFFTAFLAILISPLYSFSWTSFPILFLLLICVTAVINFTNFMDGLDGLVAGCMLLAITAAAIHLEAPLNIWALIGALLGFFPWNWSPAKVFMGDVGSTFLGAVFSFLVLQASSWSEAIALLLVATPLLGDSCVCVIRRFIAGQSIFQAHRLHLFQRLNQAGWSHARVSSLFFAATSALVIALLFGNLTWVFFLAAFELLIGIWLDQRKAVPFTLASCQ